VEVWVVIIHSEKVGPSEYSTSFADAFELFAQECVRGTKVDDWHDWLRFKAASTSKQWVYLIWFGDGIYAWGTTSGQGKRLRNACLFHDAPQGKYDRRVDYRWLMKIFGKPGVWIFETADARGLEERLKQRMGTRFCFGGLVARDRAEVSRQVFELFRKTIHWTALSQETQGKFEAFLTDIYFTRARHPAKPKRTFAFGDSLEPRFIDRTLGRPELIVAIEEVLGLSYVK
jgi:hypothetical protein